MSSVGEAFPREQERLRQLLVDCAELGPSCAFLKALVEGTLRQADEAMASGDVVAIVAAYQAMKEITA